MVVAIIERKFGFVPPKGLEEYESYYLVPDDATQFSKFRDAVDGAVDVAWPAPWLVRELKEFEQEIAESALEILQDTPEGQAILDAMLAIAIYRHRQEGSVVMATDSPRLVWQSADEQSALYCGDGLSLMASMPPNSVDCIWTDPPYLLSNDGVTCVAGKRVSVNKGEWDRSRRD